MPRKPSIDRAILPFALAALALYQTAQAAAQPESEPAEIPAATADEDSVKEELSGEGTEVAEKPSVQERDDASEADTGGQLDAMALERRLAEVEARAARAEKAAANAQAEAQAAHDALADMANDTEQERLRIYGFADFGLRKIWLDEDSGYQGLIGTKSEFLLGNVNLYFDAKPEETVRALVEVRFTTYPYGFFPNRIYDVTSATGRNNIIWSGIVLERAQIEWKGSDELGLLAGYFLTPYGIWNVDHGTPVLISSALPEFYATEYFPTRQLGVQALGAFQLGDGWETGYRAYVSNGRSPIQGDTDNNKNVGGRLYLSSHGDNATTLGASAFRGTYRDPDLTTEYREWGVAGDFSLDVSPLRVRSEIVAQRIEYEEGQRPALPTGGFAVDDFRWNAYGLAAYALPWAGLEPYLYAEYGRRKSSRGEGFSIASGGLNVNFSPITRLKLQYYRVNMYEDSEGLVDGFHVADARLVTVF